MLKALREQNRIIKARVRMGGGGGGRSYSDSDRGSDIEDFIIKLAKKAKASYRNLSGNPRSLIQPEIKGIDESSAKTLLLKTLREVEGESVSIRTRDGSIDSFIDRLNSMGLGVCKADYYDNTLYFRIYL